MLSSINYHNNNSYSRCKLAPIPIWFSLLHDMYIHTLAKLKVASAETEARMNDKERSQNQEENTNTLSSYSLLGKCKSWNVRGRPFLDPTTGNSFQGLLLPVQATSLVY